MDIETLIVDDEPAARRRLRMLIKADPEFKVIGECGDGRHAAEMIRNLNPALVFLDVQIPGADGFGVLQQIAACRGAVNSLLVEIVEGEIRFHVLTQNARADSREARAAENLVEILRRYIK